MDMYLTRASSATTSIKENTKPCGFSARKTETPRQDEAAFAQLKGRSRTSLCQVLLALRTELNARGVHKQPNYAAASQASSSREW